MPRGGVKKKKIKIRNRSGTDWEVYRGLLLCATWWRKKKIRKNRSRTDRAVCREISSCATGWCEEKKKKEEFFGRGPFAQKVLDFVLCRFVPRGGGRMEGDEKKKKKRGEKKKLSYVGLVVRKKK